MKLFIKSRTLKMFFIVITITLMANFAYAAGQAIKIGVLAKRGIERCLAKWSPTAKYLSDQIPGKTFIIAPLGFDDIYPAVESSEIDFILSNSSFYVELESWYGITRIATFKNKIQTGISTTFGGVIFCKKTRKDIHHLSDLKGKTFMAVKETSFGGWRTAWRELKEAGIDPFKDFASLRFGGTHDAVVYEVRDGKIDAGTVRTDTLERMQSEGKVRINEFHVIHEHGGRKVHLPLLHSTREYPEWPFSKLQHVSNEVAERVAVELINMPEDSEPAKASKSAGWTIPLNYQPVHDCLKELRLGPYKDYGKITLTNVTKKYWQWMLVITLLFVAVLGAAAFILRLNRNIKKTYLELNSEIEERKSAEVTLRESKERFRTIMETIVDPLVVYDIQGEVTFLNPSFTRLFEWTFDELFGHSIDFVPEEEIEAKEKSIARVFQGKAVSGHETWRKTKSGKRIAVRVGAALLLDPDGKSNGMVVNFQDITKEKQAKEKLNLMNQELEIAIKQANIMAQQAEVANIAKSDFLANMSHEIRTPMNGVVGMTNLLLETKLSAEQQEFTKIIQTSADSLLDIINDILDFSKIEAGKLELENIDFDLRLALDEASDIIAIKADEKGLEFINVFDHEIPSLLCGDPGRLRQVLINLVGNSIKFTEKGEVVIRTELESEDAAHAIVRISVIDTGIGIPTDLMEKIFQSFSQVDSSTTRKYGGTGLGLTISKQLVKKMGGSMGVESEEGKGSTFWFTAVFKKQPEGRDKKRVLPENIKGKRFLIVDDNKTNRYILKKQLALWECRYEEASGGEEALAKLKAAFNDKDPFEIAILDMQMPQMDGAQLGEKIKQNPDLKNTILVLMSSMGQRGDAKQFKDIGFAAYLIKPVKQSQLFDSLSTVAGTHKESKEKQRAAMVTRHSLVENQKHNKRILLAEDNHINRKVAINILKKLGYSADIAANGKEAVKALEMIPYDIVLMDCQMPEMDGYDATREIRNPESKSLNHNVTIIAMTANAMKEDREKCLESGMDDYLSKPVKPQELDNMLKKWLSKHNESSLNEPLLLEEEQSEKEVLDWAGFLERAMDDEEIAKEIFNEYLKEIPIKIEKINKAVNNGDTLEVKREAHTLKGSSANAGAVALQDIACKIEEFANNEDLKKAAALVPELEKSFKIIRRQYNDIIRKAGG